MISLIVLAAGKSTRMKENKLLLRTNDETLVERVVSNATKSNADETIVVLGYEAEKIRDRLARFRCRTIVNDKFEKGQSESVKVGLSAVAKDPKAVMILPADVALVEASSINKVMDEYHSSESRIVIASYRHESGHPILLDRTLFPEISQIDEATLGLKAVIDRHRAEVKYVDVGTENVLIDIDTREEFDEYFRKPTG
jgi:molybdenum cofactor cytidylyltransferase